MRKTKYNPDTSLWVERKNKWLAMGIELEDMIKPKIAVVNTSAGSEPGSYRNLDELSRIVQQAILDAGALPFEVRTKPLDNPAVSARMKMGHPMLARDLLAKEIQDLIEGAFLEGMVCISSDDTDISAHLIAAARINIPAIILTSGSQTAALCETSRLDDQFFEITNAYDELASLASEWNPRENYVNMPQTSVMTTGARSGLSMAISMQLAAEALGMTLPGNSAVRATEKRLWEFARWAGETIVKLTLDNCLPSDILTAKAFENAIMVMLAAGGSIGTAQHLSAIAAATGQPLDVLSMFERLSPLTAIRSNGASLAEVFEGGSGTAALMTRLRDSLNLDSMTVNQVTLGETIAGFGVNDGDTILPLQTPLNTRPPIVILQGSLAPDGALIRLSALPPGCERIAGPARVFTSEYSAVEAVRKGDVRKGDVIILWSLDPERGVDRPLPLSLPAALHGSGLAETVAVVTDGQLSGLDQTIVAAFVMPDATSGGPLAVVLEGDWIVLDFIGLRILLDIPDEEMHVRLSSWQAFHRVFHQPNEVSPPELVLEPCWRRAVLDEPYQPSGASIHGRLNARQAADMLRFYHLY